MAKQTYCIEPKNTFYLGVIAGLASGVNDEAMTSYEFEQAISVLLDIIRTNWVKGAERILYETDASTWVDIATKMHDTADLIELKIDIVKVAR